MSDYVEKIKELEEKHNAIVSEIANLEGARQQLLGKILMLKELVEEEELLEKNTSEDDE